MIFVAFPQSHFLRYIHSVKPESTANINDRTSVE